MEFGLSEEQTLLTDSVNRFLDARTNPLSTFSIDVDTASYANVRRFIGEGRTPPADAVVVEDATAGVRAGRREGFGLGVGVARGDDVCEPMAQMVGLHCSHQRARSVPPSGVRCALK